MRNSDVFASDISMLPDEEYSKVASMCESSFDDLLQRGIVPLIPAFAQQQSLRMHRTELGSGPTSLLSTLGLYDRVADFIVRSLVPHCSACGVDAVPPKSLDAYAIPSHGVLGISVLEQDNECSLRERCELLGVERGYVDGYVRSIGDLGDDQGEALLLVASATDLEVMRGEIQRWFGRGGGDLRLIHFTARTAQGRELGVLNNSWRCSKCERELARPSRSDLLKTPACSVCSGDGWIESPDRRDDRRFVACRDCRGMGFTSDFSECKFFGTQLRAVMELRFSEMAKLWLQNIGEDDTAQLLEAVCRGGFADYPIGSCYVFFSPGERALAMLVSCRLAKLKDVRFAFDGAFGDFKRITHTDAATQVSRDLLVAAIRKNPCSLNKKTVSATKSLVLKEVYCGPLQIPQVEFPLGAISAIRGGIGSGKTLLLKVIQQRFMKRRSQAERGIFGPLQRCSVISGMPDKRAVVLSCIGFERIVAQEICKTRQAKQRGIVVDDLELSCSKYRCLACSGSGVDTDGARCGACEGLLYDWRIADLPLFGSSVAELLQKPINKLGELLWSQSEVEGVCDAITEIGAGHVSLSTPLSELNPTLRRALALASHLASIREQRGDKKKNPELGLSKDLILIDGPYVLPSQHRDIIGKFLQQTEAKGATVIYASMPESLEPICTSVLRLDQQAHQAPTPLYEKYLDVRYARRCNGTVGSIR